MAKGTEAIEDLISYVRSRYPLLYIVSSEETRVERSLRLAAEGWGGDLVTWSVTEGFKRRGLQPDPKTGDYQDAPCWALEGEFTKLPDGSTEGTPILHPLQAVNRVLAEKTRALVVLYDFHRWLRPDGQDNVLLRRLRDLCRELGEAGGEEARTVIIEAPVLELPVEIEKEVHVITWPLPDREEMLATIHQCLEDLDEETAKEVRKKPAVIKAVAEGLLGLGAVEAGNVIGRSLVKTQSLDLGIVLEEKRQVVAKMGVPEWIRPTVEWADVCGHQDAKLWLEQRHVGFIFNEEARAARLDPAKGILLAGAWGVGKSMLIRALARKWRVPLLKVNIGAIFDKWYGGSEHRLDAMFQVIEAQAPCIPWFDEVDKIGLGSGDVERRMLGRLLGWMDEPKDPPVFIACTANEVDKIDDAFTRAGRLDERFWADLPAPPDCEATLRSHLVKRGVNNLGSLKLDDLAERAYLGEYSNSELESIVVSAKYAAFFDGKRGVRYDDLLLALERTTPKAKASAARLAALRELTKTWIRTAPVWKPVAATTGKRTKQIEAGPRR